MVINSLKSRGIDLNKMAKQIDELHKDHSHESSPGVKNWWNSETLEENIRLLAENLSEQTKVQNKTLEVLIKLSGKLEDKK